METKSKSLIVQVGRGIAVSLVVFLALSSPSAASASVPRSGLIEGTTGSSPVAIETVVNRVEAGGVLILSELHGNPLHIERQLEALEALSAAGRCTVSVGLEFLSWIHQPSITDFFDNKISETDFLEASEWGGNPFSDYRQQALFPRKTGGRLLGINAPRSLTSSIAKNGIAGISADETKLLPPEFALGSEAYRERFDVIMGGHVPSAAVDRYFAAQSAWDDTMAWQIETFLKSHPSHCIAVIVGDFHAAWGGGLPDRLRARNVANVVVISQIESSDFKSDSDLLLEIGPHPRFGPRADAVWLSDLTGGALTRP